MDGVTLVDANVLLDVLTDDPQWRAWSAASLIEAKTAGQLVVNPIVCAEIAPAFDFDWARLDAWIEGSGMRKEPLPFAASTVAAKAHRAYRRAGGTRTLPLPDFFIGAHAEVAGHTLLTRDGARYRTYFPGVSLICPPETPQPVAATTRV